MSFQYERIARRCDFSSRFALLVLALCLPLTTSGCEMVLGFAVLAWLAAGNVREKLTGLLTNRIAILACLLWGLFAFGTTYGSAAGSEARHELMKYRELLYIPILLSMFQRPDWGRFEKIWDIASLIRIYRRWDPSGDRWRQWGLWCIVLGTLVEVAGSYVEWIVGRDIGFQALHDNVVFKDRIIQSLLVAFAVYFLAYRALDSRRWCWLYAGAIGVSLFSLFVLVPGRTGYVVLAALTALLMWQRFRWRGLAAGTTVGLLVVAGAFAGSPMFRARMQQTVAQSHQYLSGGASGGATSPVEPRLKYYELTLKLVRRSPVVGLGTGGFERAYRELASKDGSPVPAEPHNEYLAIASQIGLVGLAVWLWLLIEQWRAATRLALPDRHFAQALLVLMAIGCTANSLLHGYTGGMLYAFLTGLLFAGSRESAYTEAIGPVDSATVKHPSLQAISSTDALRPAA